MKNELPIMPIRAMYADKSVEGKDLNKVGDIVPVVITEGFNKELFEKAIEAGTFVYDGRVWYVGFVTKDDYTDMYASTIIDNEFVVRGINVYDEPDDPDTITVDTYEREIPHTPKLYRHNIELNLGQYGNVYCSFVSLRSAAVTTVVDLFYWYGNNALPATGVYIDSNSQAFPIVRILKNPSNSRLQIAYVTTDNMYNVNITSQTITDTVVQL